MSKYTSRRTPLTDEPGRWFNPAAAEHFEESRTWNGNNHVSDATGSQWEHEELFRTVGKAWILHHWSQWQGSGESWVEISEEEAARWLVRCGQEHPALSAQVEALEVK